MKGLLVKILATIIFALIFRVGASAAIHVQYLSQEAVYIDAGIEDSLSIGDQLEIRKGDSLIAQLEIIFASEHSASCKILNSTGTIEIGATVNITSRAIVAKPAPADSVADTTAKKLEPAPIAVAPKPKKNSTHFSGTIALQTYNWNDITSSNLDFSQPSARINITALKLWGTELSFTLRSTIRNERRTRSYSSSVPKSEWRNRVYQLSIGYSDDNGPFGFEFGRIISNKISGIGYIDGILVHRRVSKLVNMGVFVGTQPQWQYSDFQTSIQKYGFYTNYARGEYAKSRYEVTLAAAGEYHSNIVSREFIYLQNNLIIKGDWNIFQSAELDLNRGWRKEKSKIGTSLTNFYLSTRKRVTGWLSASLSFDSRKNYWTYEIRSMAEQLFDSNVRRGGRADISLRLPGNFQLLAGFGLRKRATESGSTYSYSGALNKSNILNSKLDINIQMSGFTNPLTNGYNVSTTLGRYFGRGNYLSIGYSGYVYSIQNGGPTRSNTAYQLSSMISIIRSVYFSGQYEYDTGDDTKGHRIVAELGYRF